MRATGKTYLVLALYLLFPFIAGGQGNNTEGKLVSLFTGILNESDDKIKLSLNDSVIHIVNSYAHSDSVFDHKFNSVRNLGQIVSPDSRLKLITWNIMLREGSNRYYLYIIYKDRKRSEHIHFLTASYKTVPPDTMKLYTKENWYGALYYAIQPFRLNGETVYALLGYDFGSSGLSRKIIDFISFDDTKPIFGSDCLLRNGNLKKRDVLEYSPEGVVSLKFESSKRIIFDHISPFSTGHEGSPDRLGAGLFFDSYRLRKGLWHFESNIDIRNTK